MSIFTRKQSPAPTLTLTPANLEAIRSSARDLCAQWSIKSSDASALYTVAMDSKAQGYATDWKRIKNELSSAGVKLTNNNAQFITQLWALVERTQNNNVYSVMGSN